MSATNCRSHLSNASAFSQVITIMPVWGNRMVCETANYKHIEEKKKEFLDRENSLGQWMKEKTERKRRLHRLNERIRQGSICSTGSQFKDDNLAGSVDLVSLNRLISAPSV